MPNKEFLEEYPLFKKFKTKIYDKLNGIPMVPINMNCDECKSMQTFTMTNNYYELKDYINYPSKNEKIRLEYTCTSCNSFQRIFYIYISPELDYIYKIGQYPSWEIKIDKNLDAILGSHAADYKKGVVCESQGYGIGAFAYYRRITENIIDGLLDSISDLIELENKEKYLTALTLTKKTRITQEKIDLIKDLLPSILRPNGMNPLGVLHSELSEGIHAKSDEECLEIAAHVREIITFMVNQVIITKDSSKKFTDGMRALLDKKAKT
ncbi:MAG: hypothetical protein JST82_15755 [Bacteroidetes bacterium]|nr:hypothetical protein [Bacteroidota bacterium]